VAAAERGDEMLGTAFPAARLLLVEQPAGWVRTGLGGSGFDPAVARRLTERISRLGVRVLAVRRPGRRPDDAGGRRWGFADCRPGRSAMASGWYDDPAELLDLDPDALPLAASPPVYLVCTHGTHDLCCAVAGRPVAAALAEECPDRVWECSHVGGDRFAANVLVLPTGQLYGRVTDPAELLAATEAGRVLPARLRGRIGLSPAAQAAVVHGQRELGLLTPDAITVEGITERPPDVQLVRISSVAGAGTVAVRRVAGDRARLTCRAVRDAVPLSYRPLWLRLDPSPDRGGP